MCDNAWRRICMLRAQRDAAAAASISSSLHFGAARYQMYIMHVLEIAINASLLSLVGLANEQPFRAAARRPMYYAKHIVSISLRNHIAWRRHQKYHRVRRATESSQHQSNFCALPFWPVFNIRRNNSLFTSHVISPYVKIAFCVFFKWRWVAAAGHYCILKQRRWWLCREWHFRGSEAA